MDRLTKLREAIGGPHEAAAAEARRHLDALTKPPGSLGRLEELAVRLVALTGRAPRVTAPVIFTLAADHGVVAEGVSAYPQIGDRADGRELPARRRRGQRAGPPGRRPRRRRRLRRGHAAGRAARRSWCAASPPGTRNMRAGPAMTPRPGGGGHRGRRRAGRGRDRAPAPTCSAPARWASATRPRPARSRPRSPAPPRRRSPAAAPAWTSAGRRRKVEAVGARARASTVRSRATRSTCSPGLGGFEIAGLVGVILAGGRAPRAGRARRLHRRRRRAGRRAPGARRARHACSPRTAPPSPATRWRSTHLGLEPYLELELRLGEGTGAALCHRPGARGGGRLSARWRRSSPPGVDGAGVSAAAAFVDAAAARRSCWRSCWRLPWCRGGARGARADPARHARARGRRCRRRRGASSRWCRA